MAAVAAAVAAARRSVRVSGGGATNLAAAAARRDRLRALDRGSLEEWCSLLGGGGDKLHALLYYERFS